MERFLDPEILRPNLILASIYIVAFEVLKNSIINRIRDSFILGFDGKEWTVSPEYTESVLSKNKSPIYASLMWLQEVEAVNDEDIEKFEKIKNLRNIIAHEITELLMSGLPSEFADRYSEMINLLDKIERWWIVNYEIPINPDLYYRIDEIDVTKIVPCPVASLKILVDVALGSDDIALKYLEILNKS